MIETYLTPFVVITFAGFGIVIGIASAVTSFMLLIGADITFDKVLRRVMLVIIFLLGVLMIGCQLPASPCVTGFEVGVNGGGSKGRQFGERYREENAGGHATVFFDTTGACRATEY